MTECYCFPPHNYTCDNCYNFYKEREMWRTLTISREKLADTLNQLEERDCYVSEVIPDGDLNFLIVFKEPKMLNEEKPS